MQNGALLVSDRRPTSSSSSTSSNHHHPDHHQNLAFQSKQVSSYPATHDENAFSSNQHHHQHQHHSHPHHQHLSQHQQQVISDLGRPEFSSAFGLLSIDDPNVIAGIATDGTPFFDDPSQAHNQARSTTSGSTTNSDVVQLDGNGVADVETPMPMKRGSGQLLEGSQKYPISAVGASVENESTPSKEKDSKELKEFWKQYMRIPLSGSEMLSSMSGSEGVTPSGHGNKATNMSGPGHGYRRPRVASLPAVKTPIVERARDHLDSVYLNVTHPSTSTLNADDRQGPTAGTARTTREMPAGIGMDMDTAMDNPEDLRSYEAAVMARKAPTTLNLKVRRPMKGRGRGGTTSGKLRDDGSASASSGNNSPRAVGSVCGDIRECSSSSSLANAFGTGRLNSHSREQVVLSAPPGGLPPTVSLPGSVKDESSSPSLSSPTSSSAEGDDNKSDLGSLEGVAPLIGGSSRSNMMGRPSFKRLPSQTLGPDNSKRPFYGFGGEVEDRVGSGWGAVGSNNNNDGGGDRKDVLGASSAERRMRRRRMSEPSTGLNGGVGGGFDRDEKKTSRVDVSAVQNVDELWFTNF